MTDGIAIALIVAIPPTLTGVAALIMSVKNHNAVKDVHISLNSRLDQLLAVTRTSALAEGRKAERDGTL